MTFREAERLPEFVRDLKRLLKRYPTLEEDLETFAQTQLFLYHKLGIDNRGVVRIDNLGRTRAPIFKATKFACRSLKGKGSRSGIRVIYAYFEERDRIEFIQIYTKADKDVENRERIKSNYMPARAPRS